MNKETASDLGNVCGRGWGDDSAGDSSAEACVWLSSIHEEIWTWQHAAEPRKGEAGGSRSSMATNRAKLLAAGSV